MLVDCGCLTSEVEEYIDKTFHRHIDYLIITHIDNDHIKGIISLLTKMQNMTIVNILYNCYQRTSAELQGWDEKMRENVLRLYGHLPEVVDTVEGKINAEASRTLAEIILSNPAWKKAWRKDYITSDAVSIDLQDEFGKLVFLSPEKEAIDKLDTLYRRLFWEKLYKKKKEDFNKEESIFEALIRVVENDMAEDEETAISEEIIDMQTLIRYADEPIFALTDSNEASIAFVWEQGSHKILFMGDASPKTVARKLKTVYKDLPTPIIFDAIKISHHGSAHSTSKELMTVADSGRFFITGGTTLRPSIQALSRIITSTLPQGVEQREIRFNRKNQVLEELMARKSLQEKLHFSLVENGNEYELSC